MFYKVLIPDYMKIEELRLKANKSIEKQKRTFEHDTSTKRHRSE